MDELRKAVEEYEIAHDEAYELKKAGKLLAYDEIQLFRNLALRLATAAKQALKEKYEKNQAQ